MTRFSVPFAAALLTLGCGETAETDDLVDPPNCVSPSRTIGGICVPPGTADDGCPAGTLGLADGSCQPAGMTAEMCAEGFVHDGDVACLPVLPAQPCLPGLMALPGETECRAVMGCGQGKWGDLPVDATTQHVDGSYSGGSSNGSAAQPWTTIGEAYAAADPGALVAIAQGSYLEDVFVASKPVRLWGVCPEQVEIVGTGAEFGAVTIVTGGSGTEVVGVALTGAAGGISFTGSQDLVFDRVWIHDTADRGINGESTLGPASAQVTGVLIENAHDMGLIASGIAVTIEDSVFRDNQALGGDAGYGLSLQHHPSSLHPTIAAVRHSLIERSTTGGVQIVGSEVVMERVVIRDSAPRPSDGMFGRGLSVEPESVVQLSDAFIEQSFDTGIYLAGSQATIERTVVRVTSSQQSDGRWGCGLIAVTLPTVVAPPWVTLRSSLLEQSQTIGLLSQGVKSLIESTVVRDTAPQSLDNQYGRGIDLEPDSATDMPAAATIRGSAVQRSHEFGFMVAGVPATIETTLVEATQPAVDDGQYGDGIVVVSSHGYATAAVTNSRITDSSRAGLANFGATVSLQNSAFACAAFALNGEAYLDQPFVFDNWGGNGCGCPATAGSCKATSVGLVPPDPLSSDR